MSSRDANGIGSCRRTHPAAGSASSSARRCGLAGPFVGHVRFDGSDTCLENRTHRGPAGRPLRGSRLDEVLCVNYSASRRQQRPRRTTLSRPRKPTQPTSPSRPIRRSFRCRACPAPPACSTSISMAKMALSQAGVRFDAAPSGASNAQVFDVWKMVCEDYQGFNLNVTTDRKVFDAAQAGRRQHIIITPTTTAAPGAGGVAYVGSFNWSDSRALLVILQHRQIRRRGRLPRTRPHPRTSATTGPARRVHTTAAMAAAPPAGHRSWGSATIRTSPSGPRANISTPTTPRTTSRSSPTTTTTSGYRADDCRRHAGHRPLSRDLS